MASLCLTSCKKQDDVSPSVLTPLSSTATTGAVTDQEVNDWILANMKQVYLWNDKLPASPNRNLAPAQFFASLLFDRANTANPDRDRFSWIQPSADELRASLGGQSKSTGIEYRVLARPGTSNVMLSVLYVHLNSPALRAGLRRGDIITRVNGQLLTGTNYLDLLSTGDAFTFALANVTGSGAIVENGQVRQVSAVVLQQDPVLLDSVYTIGGRKIGYVVYTQFNPGLYNPNGPQTDETYDNKLNAIFARFKQQGVNELVLDLRYNPGGYVSSSTRLASLIGKNVDASKVFYTQQWNNLVTTELDRQRNGAGWRTQKFMTMPNNIGANLSRVFILTSGRTASASELVINGLRPFMDVRTIGTTTVGKNVGSITIDDRRKRIQWGIQPITFRSANAQGVSDYGAGFVPSVEVREPSVGMKAFGDLTEPLLGEAVFRITGTRMVRRAAPTVADQLPELGSSLDQKTGGGNMFIEWP